MADVKVSITVNRPRVSKYRLAGKTLVEAKENLDARDEWGLYDAAPNFKSSAQVDANGNVVSVTMVLKPEIEVPDWSGYNSATREQRASWSKMYDALLTHENKHHAIQVDCVEDLKKAIKAAKKLDAATLGDLIADLQQACQKKQDAYDARSEHGAKEGVVLKLDA